MRLNRDIDWLLQDDQPSVRYKALKDILHRSEEDPDVRRARGAIRKVGWAAEILAEQLPGGYWNNTEQLHRPKYLATFWKFLMLADLGLTAEEPRMKLTCELLLSKCARADGGFSFWPESHFCSSGMLAEALLMCGYGDDPRLQRVFDWIVQAQKDDGGWHCFPSRKGTMDCWQGLSAFAALPRKRWTRRIRQSMERGAEFYLKRRLYREGKGRYVPWFRFHYPVHYYYDLLVGLDILTALGFSDDPRLSFALKFLRGRQEAGGWWMLDAVHPDVDAEVRKDYVRYEPYWPIPFSLETAGEPSKLITLRALRVLERVGNEG